MNVLALELLELRASFLTGRYLNSDVQARPLDSRDDPLLWKDSCGLKDTFHLLPGPIVSVLWITLNHLLKQPFIGNQVHNFVLLYIIYLF